MIKIEESNILKLQEAMQKKEITSKELVLYYFSRIAEIDKCENGLNSVLELNPDALFIADSLDEMRANGTVLGPLHGIPVMLKDNISTHDKMHTSAGSVALQNNYAPYDAHIVKCLREAGALILGKANMTEFAAFMSNDMPAGYSSKGGQTLHPYDKKSKPWGSSTGSGVAVSANLCAAAVGTDTWGSTIGPSQNNGIVGIRPTLGLLSQYGIIPISHTLDTAGPMARTVTDSAILLGAMAGQTDYTQYLDKNGLEGARIGITRASENLSQEYYDVLENTITVMRQHGAECFHIPEPSPELKDALSTVGDTIISIMKHEFKNGINHYLASIGNENTIKTLQDIILFNQNHSKEALKFGQNILINAQNDTSGNLTEPEYINAILSRENMIRLFDKIFIDNEIDVIYAIEIGVESGIPPLTGFPSMTIPIGTGSDNIPLGSYWIARRYDEKSLIRVTYAMEQILNARRNPFEPIK